jgi:hypothetical protein
VVVVVKPNLPQQEKRARHDVLPLCMHACMSLSMMNNW